MRILLVTHYFPPEVGAPQARLSELASVWQADGHDVTVLTGMPNHPTGVVPPAYRRLLRKTELLGGLRVVRTWVYATPNEGFLKKTLGHLSFMISSVLLGWRKVGRADVVIVSSPTFFSIGSAWLLSKVKRASFVVEVRDLWPAIFVELGVLTNRPIIKVLELLELAAYRAADAVVVVTDGFRDDITRRGIDADKVHVIPNGVDLDRFSPARADPKTRARLGATEDQVLVLYSGAHGISQGLVAVAEAAAILRNEPMHFVFVGEGAHKNLLEERVSALALDNVTMLPAVPRDDVQGFIAAADICVVPLRDIPLFETFIPSKMFEFLAMQRPVLGAVAGESARILESAGQHVVRPEDPAAMAAALLELAGDPEQRATIGREGQEFVKSHYNRSLLAREYESILAAAAPR